MTVLLGRLAATAVFVALVVVAGCTDGGGSADTSTTQPVEESPVTVPNESITQDEAIAIARDAYAEEEPEFSFEGRFDYVAETADTYDVSWPDRELDGAGGEPHVVIDRATGEVVEIYLTR